MPQIARVVSDTDITIIRPVAMAVVRQMCEMVGIPPNVDILFPATEGVVEQAGSTMESADNTVKFTNDPHLLITVENKAGFDGLYYDLRHKTETKPIFSDPRLGLHMAPSISNRSLNIAVKYTARDKFTVDQWYQSMRTNILQCNMQILHSASAYFILPKLPLSIMHHVYTLRERKAGYGQSWPEYFQECADDGFTIMTDQAGNHKELAYAINYGEFYGYFENQTEAEKGDKNDKNESWSSSFNYIVQLDVPTDVILRYPIMVHNQYIDNKYLFEIKPTAYDKRKAIGTHTVLVEAFFGVKRPTVPKEHTIGLCLPKHDDWLTPPGTYSPYTLPLYTVLIMIDETHPKRFMNLTEVPGFELPDFVWDYIRAERKWLSVMAECLFQLEVYLQSDPYPLNTTVVTDTLDVDVLPEVDIRYRHHVRLGIYTDLKHLSENARNRLQEYGRVVDWWIKKYRPDIKWTIDRGLGENNDYVTEYDMAVITGLTGQKPMDTVESLGIKVYNRRAR